MVKNVEQLAFSNFFKLSVSATICNYFWELSVQFICPLIGWLGMLVFDLKSFLCILDINSSQVKLAETPCSMYFSVMNFFLF